MKKGLIISIILLAAAIAVFKLVKRLNLNTSYQVGQRLDSLNGVIVFYNGGVDHSSGRTVSADGYNIGIKYQCVEFVKRYYYQYLKHKMPDAYGNAKDFFDSSIADGQLNKKRNLMQYSNGSRSKPQVSDLIIFSGSVFNKYGHVAIISNVSNDQVEIIQQNPGPFAKSRINIKLIRKDHKWFVDNDRTLGWLRKEKI
jgi:surface antigen